jgi:hypothetical protein
VTPADKPAFGQAFARLAAAHREKDIDGITLHVYFEGLKAREIEMVVAAAERLMHAAWFPKLGDWHREAVKVETERIAEQRKYLRERPSLCAACGDSGWVEDTSAPVAEVKMARRNPSSGKHEEIALKESPRMKRCDCQQLRRLEVLGRRPMPMLPDAATHDGSDDAIGPVDATKLLNTIELQTGLRIAPRKMPRPAPSRDPLHRVLDQSEPRGDDEMESSNG